MAPTLSLKCSEWFIEHSERDCTQGPYDTAAMAFQVGLAAVAEAQRRGQNSTLSVRDNHGIARKCKLINRPEPVPAFFVKACGPTNEARLRRAVRCERHSDSLKTESDRTASRCCAMAAAAARYAVLARRAYFTGSVRKRSFDDFSAGSSITVAEACCPSNNCRKVAIPLVTSSANFGAT
jgi:hypothetical protein